MCSVLARVWAAMLRTFDWMAPGPGLRALGVCMRRPGGRRGSIAVGGGANISCCTCWLLAGTCTAMQIRLDTGMQVKACSRQ